MNTQEAKQELKQLREDTHNKLDEYIKTFNLNTPDSLNELDTFFSNLDIIRKHYNQCIWVGKGGINLSILKLFNDYNSRDESDSYLGKFREAGHEIIDFCFELANNGGIYIDELLFLSGVDLKCDLKINTEFSFMHIDERFNIPIYDYVVNNCQHSLYNFGCKKGDKQVVLKSTKFYSIDELKETQVNEELDMMYNFLPFIINSPIVISNRMSMIKKTTPLWNRVNTASCMDIICMQLHNTPKMIEIDHIQKLNKLYNLKDKFSQFYGFTTALHRYNYSLLRLNDIDQFLELAIALDCLFMPKHELNMLLNKTFTSRLKQYNSTNKIGIDNQQIEKIYSNRSSIVHSSIFHDNNKEQIDNLIKNSKLLIRTFIDEIIETGKYPELEKPKLKDPKIKK